MSSHVCGPMDCGTFTFTYVRSSSSLSTLERRLKTELFSQNFPD